MSGTGRPKNCSVALVAFAIALGGYGCDSLIPDVLKPPDEGTLQVTTVTGGTSIDPDGYQLLVTSPGLSDSTHSIGVNDSLFLTHFTVDLTVTLNDIAANCSADANPQVVTVVADRTVRVTFNVTCS